MEMKYPIIIISGMYIKGYDKSTSKINKSNLYAYTKGFYHNLKIYDSIGNEWSVGEVISKYPINIWTKLLANTFYNPKMEVDLKWKEPKQFMYSDLQDTITKIIEKDDDIYTQYINHDKLIKLISESKSFKELFENLKNKKII